MAMKYPVYRSAGGRRCALHHALSAAKEVPHPLTFVSDPHFPSLPRAQGDVVVLGPDNFNDLVGKSAGAFVEFYAPVRARGANKEG